MTAAELNNISDLFELGKDKTSEFIEFGDRELKNWASVFATNRLDTQYSSVTKSIPVLNFCNKKKPTYNEIRAAKTEKAILYLKRQLPELYAILFAEYVYNMPMRNEYDYNKRIARTGKLDLFKISYETYRAKLNQVRLIIAHNLQVTEVSFLA